MNVAPWDMMMWAEATQNNGVAGVAAEGPTGVGYTISGDKITIKDFPDPWIYSFGGISDSKPAETRLIPDNSNVNKPFAGPASLTMWPLGVSNFREYPIPLMMNDLITGQLNNTNVSEGSVIGCEINYGKKIMPWSLKDLPAGKLFQEPAIITSSGDVTYNSGVVTVYAACENTVNWWDTNGEYYILGVAGGTGVAEAGGILSCTNLGGQFQGYVPGWYMNTLSDIVFSTQQPFTPGLTPVGPIGGKAIKNSVSLGLCSTTAGAHKFVLWILRTK